ncbi:MAG: tRNA (adenosine(37)-N6)-threonylcarbamoyltransferase complex dimerization subunit type 1 TsaB [Pirellula sp.]
MRKTLLALETSGRSGSVAILCADTQATSLSSPELLPKGHSITSELLDPEWGSAKTLAPAIDRLLRRLELKPSSIDCIALIQGPGSFTGLRVGVATAKAMAYALRIPIVAVDGLDVIAMQIAKAKRKPQPYPLLAVVDAYRGQSFVARYIVDSGLATCVEATCVADNQAIAKRVTDWLTDEAWTAPEKMPLIVAGPGAEKMRKSLESPSVALALASPSIEWISAGDAIPMADTVARLGWDRWMRLGLVEDILGFLPRYYRSSAAEEKSR